MMQPLPGLPHPPGRQTPTWRGPGWGSEMCNQFQLETQKLSQNQARTWLIKAVLELTYVHT
jgi:hypothetical protein